MEPVYTWVTRDLDVVQASVAELKSGDAAAVTWWSAGRLRTWSSRPWNQDGEQLSLVHHASVNIEVKFRDFAALSAWVGEHTSNTEGFRVTNITWALTMKRRDEVIRQVRERAVRDAVDRAQLYANALGFATINPVAIADVGMLAAERHSNGVPRQISSMARSGSGQGRRGPGVALAPQDIEVAASVDARFVAEVAVSPFLSSEGVEELPVEEHDVVSDPSLESDVCEFRDDDAGYLQWLAAHPNGYVVNILRSYSPSASRLHHARCWTIQGQQSKEVALTGQYVKICAEQLAELDQWAVEQMRQPIARCGTCHPDSVALQVDSASQCGQVDTAGASVRHDVSGPTPDTTVPRGRQVGSLRPPVRSRRIGRY